MPANLTINSATGLISGALAAGGAGSYNVTVTVSDGNGGTDNVTFTWTVNAPGGGGGDILYIVPNVNNLNAADQAIYNQLIGLGYTISLVRDRDAAVGDANGKALIVISYSASRNLVGTMYKNSAVPAMIWDGAILSDMGMVTSTGSVSGQSQIKVIDASHPMADGHSNGNVTIATTGTKVRWGFPTASADSIAEVAGQPNKSAIFAYETGDSMNGLNAPHRRVGFFIDSTTPVDLNANGWGLFDAAVEWAVNGGSSTYMPDPNQAIAATGAFKGNRMGKRGASAKIQAISGSIQRISLSFAGQPVAVQVSGDPDPADNGLFHIYADHLGSSGSLSDSSGAYIPNSHAKYTPFGDWRTEPTATAGDRYYTNHKHNNLGGGADDLGLIYMNARYYLPGVGRFASADSIVPNATNPQAYNRYSYVENRPNNFRDPSGHELEVSPEGYDSMYQSTYEMYRFLLDSGIKYIEIDGILFDMDHARTNWELAEKIYTQWSSGTVKLRWSHGYEREYEVDPTLSGAALDAAAQNLWYDFVSGYEELQEQSHSPSAWSIEDMPSNYLGFISYVYGGRKDLHQDIANMLTVFTVENYLAGNIGDENGVVIKAWGNWHDNKVVQFFREVRGFGEGVYRKKNRSTSPLTVSGSYVDWPGIYWALRDTGNPGWKRK